MDDAKALYPNCSEFTYVIPIADIPKGFEEKLEAFLEKEEMRDDCGYFTDEVGDREFLVIDGYTGDQGGAVGDFLMEEIGTQGITVNDGASYLSSERIEITGQVPRDVRSFFRFVDAIDPFINRGIYMEDVAGCTVIEFQEDCEFREALYTRLIEILEKSGASFKDKTGYEKKAGTDEYKLLFGEREAKEKIAGRLLEAASTAVGSLHYLALILCAGAELKGRLARRICYAETGYTMLHAALLAMKKKAPFSVRNAIGGRLLAIIGRRKEAEADKKIYGDIARYCTGGIRKEAEFQAVTMELKGVSVSP